MKETKTAINEFESESDSIQYLGHNLNTALRGLGDVDNFLEILSVRSLINEKNYFAAVVQQQNFVKQQMSSGCCATSQKHL